MEERNDVDNKIDEVMLPGFRFHPTDEELVGFYLKRKIQQRPLSIELIKQLDIYKYDPWDLPKLATTGEKEWYFYCPRDRKYRNSARPNRVTGAGFWKATGTDRPIYSSEGNKCIGLKKSLVFYKGRAARGIKTDWMMHEFRLPSLTDSTPPKRFIDKTIPANDSWAICRIFKKTNSTTQRALSQSWVSPILPEPSASSSSLLAKGSSPLTAESCGSTIHLNYINNNNHHEIIQNHHDHQPSMITNFSPLDFTTYNYSNNNNKPTNLNPLLLSTCTQSGNNFFFSPLDQTLASAKCTVDVSNSMFLNMASSSSSSSMLGEMSNGNIDFGGPSQDHCINGFFSLSSSLLPQMNNINTSNIIGDSDQWEIVKSINGFPFNLGDAWKPNLLWDSSSSEMSTSFATAKCYT